MKARIGNYEIRDLDEHNFVMIEHYVTKGGLVAGRETESGIEKERNIGYYGRIENALNSLINKHLKTESDVSTAQELLKAFNTLETRLKLELDLKEK